MLLTIRALVWKRPSPDEAINVQLVLPAQNAGVKYCLVPSHLSMSWRQASTADSGTARQGSPVSLAADACVRQWS